MHTYVITFRDAKGDPILGDWQVVRAESPEAAVKTLTRTQRKRVYAVQVSIPTSERRALAEAEGLAFPVMPGKRRR